MNSDFLKTEGIYGKILQQQLTEHKAILFTLSTCERSKSVKSLFKQKDIDFEYFDLDKIPDGKQFLLILQKMTSTRLAPYFFYNQKYIGGHREAEAYSKNPSVSPFPLVEAEIQESAN
jgi:glutaredoxin